MFQSTVAPSADRFRGRRGGSMRIAFPSEDEVAAKDFIGFAALSRTLFPPLCSRIVLKTTLTAGGTPRQRRMERRPPLTFFRSSLVTMRGRQSLTAPSLLSPCSLRSRLRRPMRHGGGARSGRKGSRSGAFGRLCRTKAQANRPWIHAAFRPCGTRAAFAATNIAAHAGAKEHVTHRAISIILQQSVSP